MSSQVLLLLLLGALLLAAIAATAESLRVLLSTCQARCGDVDIPYPFGIGSDCSREGFEISCVSNGINEIPVLLSLSVMSSPQYIRVLNLSVMPFPEARVMLPVAWQCYNSTGARTSQNNGDVNINRTYRISNTGNELVVLGCNTFVFTNSGPRGRFHFEYYAGCVAACNDSQSARDGACAGIGCCHVDIPPGLTDYRMRFAEDGEWTHANQEFSPCDYAFIVEKDRYKFEASHLTSMRNQTMPVLLDWAIRDNNIPMSCAEAANEQSYACVSEYSECVNSINGPGYFCSCAQGYEGNPYLPNGCTNINECLRPEKYACHGDCQDTEGSYDCKCPPGHYSTGDPKEKHCSPIFSLAAKLALGVSVGILFLVVAVLSKLTMYQKRRLSEVFRQNGGKRLKDLGSLIFFTEQELKKITRNNAKLLGKGRFGEVYKGTLADEDNTEVAVKTSIEVNEATEEEFVKEVMIQSKMIHKNILKLLGCCLEVRVPVLVYEYAANGSLHDILHGKENHQIRPLPLDQRLEIAIGSAEGLAYMHKYTRSIIQHGDVKPANILLDELLVPKISDFGLSRLLTAGKQYTMLVVGCLGYMDPVFQKTGRLTPGSDVYSFGVVLLELIARKPIIYGENRSLIMEFLRVYEQDNSGRKMFDREIAATEDDILVLEGIGRLAIECLKEEVEARPDMTDVARRLVTLQTLQKQRNSSEQNGGSPTRYDGCGQTTCDTSNTSNTEEFQ